MSVEQEVKALRARLDQVEDQLVAYHKLFMAMRQSYLLNTDQVEQALGIEPRTSHLRRIAKGK